MGCCGNKHVSPVKQPMPQKQETGPFGVFATKDIREARMKTCNSCPEFKPKILHVTSLCKQCGCILEAKTWLRDAECPLKKWAN